ncbi:MAG TPA: hypothetical protein VM661_01725 [Candidatus Sulfotelmatobacter sp.]|jgi:hypothetical protein|nr:hypothetical protein [Candidatus Sulfotelmatobacter sp.]
MRQEMITQPEAEDAEAFAQSLSAAADRLAQARDPEAFVAAMADQRNLWVRMRKAAPSLSYKIPDRIMDFSISVTSKSRGGWNDQEIEALISVDRSTSQEIFRATRLPAE